jgi:3-oxoisoapionate decarboxylase
MGFGTGHDIHDVDPAVSSFTFTWAIGVPGFERPSAPMNAAMLLQTAAYWGLRLVQIADNMPLHMMTGEELMGLRALAQKLFITIEAGTRGTDPEHLLNYLRVASGWKPKDT